jgi:hypothetical protein
VFFPLLQLLILLLSITLALGIAGGLGLFFPALFLNFSIVLVA